MICHITQKVTSFITNLFIIADVEHEFHHCHTWTACTGGSTQVRHWVLYGNRRGNKNLFQFHSCTSIHGLKIKLSAGRPDLEYEAQTGAWLKNITETCLQILSTTSFQGECKDSVDIPVLHGLMPTMHFDHLFQIDWKDGYLRTTSRQLLWWSLQRQRIWLIARLFFFFTHPVSGG